MNTITLSTRAPIHKNLPFPQHIIPICSLVPKIQNYGHFHIEMKKIALVLYYNSSIENDKSKSEKREFDNDMTWLIKWKNVEKNNCMLSKKWFI